MRAHPLARSPLRPPGRRLPRGFPPSTTISALLLTVSLFLSAPAQLSALAFGVEDQLEAVLVDDPRFPPKLQPGVRLSVFGEIDPLPWLRFGVSCGYHVVGFSAIDGGFRYRGHTGLDARLLASVRVALESGGYVGLSAGGLVRLDRYVYTSLYFFYPGVCLGLSAEKRLPGEPGRRLGMIAGAELYFRRDLDAALAVGIAVNVPVWFREPRAPKEEA